MLSEWGQYWQGFWMGWLTAIGVGMMATMAIFYAYSKEDEDDEG